MSANVEFNCNQKFHIFYAKFYIFNVKLPNYFMGKSQTFKPSCSSTLRVSLCINFGAPCLVIVLPQALLVSTWLRRYRVQIKTSFPASMRMYMQYEHLCTCNLVIQSNLSYPGALGLGGARNSYLRIQYKYIGCNRPHPLYCPQFLQCQH